MTLIELMTVIAIVGILASVAIPLYNSQNWKKNRAIAISSLLQYRAQLEKCFLNNQPNNYNGCTLDTSKAIDTKNRYNVAAVYGLDLNNDRISYTLTATSLNVNNSSKTADTECVSFSISNIGIKLNTGSGSVQRCWSQ